MSNSEEISVGKEEVGEDWERADKALKIFENLLEDGFRFSTWVTNSSLALLGFYFALLIQFKLSEVNYLNYTTFFPFGTLVISLLLGFYLKIRHEFRGAIAKLLEILNEIYKFTEAVGEKLAEKGTEKNEDDFPIEKLTSFLDEARYDLPINLITTQFYFLAISVLWIVYCLIKFLLS